MSSENSQEKKAAYTDEWKRGVGFVDTGGVKDAAGEPVRFTRLSTGELFPPFGEEFIRNAMKMDMRPDDILLCGYPKTGCHWVWEISNMILKGKAEHSRIGKSEAFIELVSPEILESMPSPRVLNTHFRFNELPPQAIDGKNKILLTFRNPKDTAVSLYNHHKNLKHFYNYNGKFNDWFPLYIEGNVDYNSYLDFHLEWEKAMTEHPDHPILLLKYEDLKEDTVAGVRRIAEFLGVSLTDEMIQDIARAADIDAMKKQFDHVAVCKPALRKGQVGDWKNWLTVAQSEAIDEAWGEQLSKTRFTTRFLI